MENTTFPETRFTNLVNVFGYQLEKVHTAIIAWILDSRHENLGVSQEARCRALSRLLDLDEPIDPTGVKIEPHQEKNRVDLLVDVETIQGRNYRLVFEAKVDTDIREKQIKDISEGSYGNGDNHFYLLTLGASQVTYQHLASLHKFEVIDVQKALEIFGPAGSDENSLSLVGDWLAALREEQSRRENVVTWYKECKGNCRLLRDSQGFRSDNHIFYYWYDHLRQQLESIPRRKWMIYPPAPQEGSPKCSIGNGVHNAVLSVGGWWVGFTNEEYHCRSEWEKAEWSLELFWEFNDAELLLKVAPSLKIPPGIWDRVAEKMEGIQKYAEHIPGMRRASRRRQAFSALRREFDLWTTSPEQVAAETYNILGDLIPRIELALKDVPELKRYREPGSQYA